MTPTEPQRIPIRDKRGQFTPDEPAPESAGPSDVSAAEASLYRADADEAAGSGPGETEVDHEAVSNDRLDQLMRLKADFENFRKRTLREQTELVERASQRIVEQLLPVLDDLERAIESARDQGAPGPLVKGVELVVTQFHGLLQAEGIERVTTDGAFDPAHHEAVSTQPSDVSEPTIGGVIRSGYTMKGKPLRPALVQVLVPDQEAEGEGT